MKKILILTFLVLLPFGMRDCDFADASDIDFETMGTSGDTVNPTGKFVFDAGTLTGHQAIVLYCGYYFDKA